MLVLCGWSWLEGKEGLAYNVSVYSRKGILRTWNLAAVSDDGLEQVFVTHAG